MANDILEVDMERKINGTNIINCDCRPTCTDIFYDLEISQNNVLFYPVTKSDKELYDET